VNLRTYKPKVLFTFGSTNLRRKGGNKIKGEREKCLVSVGFGEENRKIIYRF